MSNGILTTFVVIAGGIAAVLMVVYVSRYELAYKNRRTGWVIKILFLAAFLGLFWGWAAIGFVIGLAAGAVIGTIAGVSIGLMSGSLIEPCRKVMESNPLVGMMIRLAAGGIVGALHGAAIGLMTLTMGGVGHVESGVAGAAVGAVVGMAIARHVSTTSEGAVRAETNSLEGAGIGTPAGVVIGAVVGASMMASGGLMGMMIAWLQ